MLFPTNLLFSGFKATGRKLINISRMTSGSVSVLEGLRRKGNESFLPAVLKIHIAKIIFIATFLVRKPKVGGIRNPAGRGNPPAALLWSKNFGVEVKGWAVFKFLPKKGFIYSAFRFSS